MNEFIHTFSGVTYFTETQFNRMKDTYNRKELFPYNNEKWVFCKYADRGFRMEIIYTPFIEKQKGRKYEDFKAEWIVTPAKLLYPGQGMMKLYDHEDYAKACGQLADIFHEVNKDSGTDLLHKAKLYRVDVTKDIETPSEAYTHEVIRLAKAALHQYGYRLWEVENAEERKEEWTEENGVFYYNNNQDVKAKIYNKVEDLKIHGHDTVQWKGLLRFELALKRTFLKKENYICEKYITIEELTDALKGILFMASTLMQTHFADPLWSGAMVSKELQKKFIRRYCGFNSKSAKYKKMIAYRKACNQAKSMEKVKKNTTSIVKDYFREMGLSPLCTCDDISYIPSFADLLNGTENAGIKAFVDRMNLK